MFCFRPLSLGMYQTIFVSKYEHIVSVWNCDFGELQGYSGLSSVVSSQDISLGVQRPIPGC